MPRRCAFSCPWTKTIFRQGLELNLDAGQDPKQYLNEETVSLGGGKQVCVLLLPVGKLKPESLLGSLTVHDRDRAASLQSPARYAEYVTSRWLLQQLPRSTPGAVTISHCRRWIAVAGSDSGALGLDVECRLPRQLPEVVERLCWENLEPGQYLQAWTLWEAWRKLAGGSVLDEPDAVYANVLAAAASLFESSQRLQGITWWSKKLEGACLSLAWRS